MSNAVKILPHYTYSDYEQWEGRWEVIEGIPYAMSPLPVPKHQRIAAELSAEFVFQLKKCRKCRVYQPLDYLVKEDTVLQPDMLIVCKEINEKYLDFAPELVVEILSPSTSLKDRHNKFPIYESQGIPYFIIVSPEPEEVEIYEIENNSYKLRRKDKDFSYEFTFGICKAVIDFAAIW